MLVQADAWVYIYVSLLKTARIGNTNKYCREPIWKSYARARGWTAIRFSCLSCRWGNNANVNIEINVSGRLKSRTFSLFSKYRASRESEYILIETYAYKFYDLRIEKMCVDNTHTHHHSSLSSHLVFLLASVHIKRDALLSNTPSDIQLTIASLYKYY